MQSKEFGRTVKDHRNALNLTQSDLAEKIPYSLQTIRSIEQGKYPLSDQVVKALADFFELKGQQRDKFYEIAFGENSEIALVSPTKNQSHILTNLSLLRKKSSIYFSALVFLLFALYLIYMRLNDPDYSNLDNIRLQPINQSQILLADANQIIINNSNVKVNEPVYIIFAVKNTSKSAVKIRALVAAARGTSAKKLGWSDSNFDFDRAKDIVLEPEEIYLYSAWRKFSETGIYLIAPAMQDVHGNWGGIHPFYEIYLDVR